MSARALERARARIKILERMVEDQTRALYLSNQALQTQKDFFEQVLLTLPNSVMVAHTDGTIATSSNATHTVTGYDAKELNGRLLSDLLPPTEAVSAEALAEALTDPNPRQFEHHLIPREGPPIPVLVNTRALADGEGAVVVAMDLRQRRQLEMNLRQAQKLEAVGQLAAGVAHEMNTPIQFISDSLSFLAEAFTDYRAYKDMLQDYLGQARDKIDDLLFAEAAIDGEADVLDIEYLDERIAPALDRTRDGVQRLAEIVGAMRALSHPGQKTLTPSDLNKVVSDAALIARNSWRYVAELSTDFEALPPVPCLPGELGQVIINLIVNAAHAIEARFPDSGEVEQPGRIRVSTRVDGEMAVVEITDNGGGIPAAVQDRIFEPFFTTKDVGKGTGQGLPIARSIIVEQHKGDLSFRVEEGEGTTFQITLPLLSSQSTRQTRVNTAA